MFNLKSHIEHKWYSRPGWLYLFMPLMWLFSFVSQKRKQKLRTLQQKQAPKINVPVCIIGNISVGGTGKTPVIIFLVKLLQSQGLKVGVVTRGYGTSQTHLQPIAVTDLSTAAEVGDEPIAIYRQTRCPIYVCKNRVKACIDLVKNEQVHFILSDDGMQHYALPRQIEIAVMDGVRLIGNQHLMPVGPLREPPERLQNVDWLLVNGQSSHALFEYTQKYKWPRAVYFSMQPQQLVNIKTGELKSVNSFCDKAPLVAIAGIGHPQRFFNTLSKLGYTPTQTKAFADHYSFTQKDFSYPPDTIILMTEKDAVKCETFATDNMWYLSIDIALDMQFQKDFLSEVTRQISLRGSAVIN